MDAPPAVELTALTREYRTRQRTVTALDRLDLTVPQGQLVAVLGENGAGKTTLAKILATLLLPTSGSAHVLGHDVAAEPATARTLVTAVFGGDRGLYPMLSGHENLRYFGAVNGVPRRELRRRMPGLLASAGLTEAASRRVETYSKGMRQRLHVCIGLLTRPRVLLLDEPTVGLDPNESARLREVIARFPGQGTTVLLTSHNLLDVEHLAERVVMLREGRLTHDLPLDRFRRLAGHEAVVTARLAPGDGHPRDGSHHHDGAHPHDSIGTPARLSAELTALGAVLEPEDDGTARLTLAVERWSAELLGRISAGLRGWRILDLQVRQATLEEAFARAAFGAPGGQETASQETAS